MDWSTIIGILVAAIVLVIVLRILSGLLRIGIALAIIAVVGYWLYTFLTSHYPNIFMH